MIYWTVIWSIICFIVMPMDSIIANGVTSSSLINSLSYVFFHASWIHLIINVISTCAMWYPIRRLYMTRYNEETYLFSFATYIAAVIAGAACATTTPTVGMSGMLFFLIGALLMLNPTKRQVLSYIWIVAALAVQLYFGHSNVPLHLFAFAEGVIFICVREFLYQYKKRLNTDF